MGSPYPNLFSPLTIRGHVYRNRIQTAPTMFAHAAFIPEVSENIFRLWEKRAAGGAAVVCVGEVGVNDKEGATFNLVKTDYSVHSGPFFDVAKEYAARIKKHGALAFAELCHEGQEANPVAFGRIWGDGSPSVSDHAAYGPVDLIRPDGGVVKAFDADSMASTCRDLETCAAFIRAAGFDGILFHGGHGFVVQQFISPLFNQRTDEFGGSMENRAKFPLMMFDALRRGMGPDMILELRMSAEDHLPGGMTDEDVKEFARLIDGKIDVLHVSTGIKWIGNRTGTFSDMYDAHGLNLDHAHKIKSVLTKTKISVVGGLNDPDLCENAIASGAADLVVFGRQAFADPEFPNKAACGKADRIRRCVRCFHCYPGIKEHETDIDIFTDLSPEEAAKAASPAAMGNCAINPESNLALYPDRMPRPIHQRKVLVIGGGVAGMQAAITATERGHKVVLVEKSDRLGGTLNFTDYDELKQDLNNFKNVLVTEASESAEVRLNCEADADLIAEIAPDHIIIANGCEPRTIPIPGVETTINALSAYSEADRIGRRVVIIGGGMAGCETGLFLRHLGHDVLLLEMLPRLAPEVTGYYRVSMIDEMDKRGVTYLTETKCEKITIEGVYALDKNGAEQFYPADTVVLSVGMKSADTAALTALCGSIPYTLVGDCETVGNVATCVSSGYMAAMNIL